MAVLNPFSEAFKRKMNGRAHGPPIYFGPFEVTNQVFLQTPHSFALVNLKPLLPGHVLVCPKDPRHQRLTDLSAAELTDLFLAVQRVQRMLARHYFTRAASRAINPGAVSVPGTPRHPSSTPEGGSFNIAIQDGAEAGQTVPHLHVHVIPRIRGATAKAAGPADEIYEEMAAEEGNVGGALWDRHRGIMVVGNGESNGKQNRLRHHHGRAGEQQQQQNGNGNGSNGAAGVMEERPEAGGGFPRIEDQARKPRSPEEMAEEADLYMGILGEMEVDDGLDGAS
ncbi:HIT-like protein [Xylariomycetidae sp. FL2044]|nr:HIT-like protein [Xylariomycetidae sp. FL2044]